MNALDKTLNEITDAQSKATDKLLKWVRSSFPYIILALNIIVSVVSRLFKTWLVNPFSADFFISLATNILTTTLAYVCFVQYGEKMEKLNMPKYEANLSVWTKISQKVRTAHSEDFIAFCKKQIADEIYEKRLSIIGNNTLISTETYKEVYYGKSDAAIDKFVAEGVLSERDAVYVKKANGNMRVKPIKPLIILCGIKSAHLNDAGRDGLSYSTVSILARPALMFVLTAVVTMFKGAWIGVGDASAIYDMIYSATMIVVSAVMGYTAGATSAHYENEKIIARILFLEKFLKTVPEEEATEKSS